MGANYSKVDRSGMDGFLFADPSHGLQDVNISGTVVATKPSECVPVDLFDNGQCSRCRSTIDCVLVPPLKMDDAIDAPIDTTMRADIIGHFKPCMTDIYLHIDARMADYIRTHP